MLNRLMEPLVQGLTLTFFPRSTCAPKLKKYCNLILSLMLLSYIYYLCNMIILYNVITILKHSPGPLKLCSFLYEESVLRHSTGNHLHLVTPVLHRHQLDVLQTSRESTYCRMQTSPDFTDLITHNSLQCGPWNKPRPFVIIRHADTASREPTLW